MADDQHDDQHDDEVRKNAPNYYSHGKALAAARAHRAAVVESSPEVAALRARVAELEAAAKPKARDESVPPPGWILWWKDGDEQTPENIERADRAMRDGPLVTAIPIAQAWRFYDRDHGYAPDEARIRADERARTERDIAAWVTSEDPADADVRSSWLALGEPVGPNWIAAVVERSEYPRIATGPKCEAEVASSLRAALSTLVDAVYRVCDWSEGSRVGDALAEAEALLAPPTSTTANGEHDHG